MELPLFSIPVLLATIFSSLLFLYHVARKNSMFRPKVDIGHKKPPAPRIPGAWPIIGHLHLLGGSGRPTHQTLSSMADKYGPIFTLKLGSNEALVVSNEGLAKECFVTNDRVFASRPKSIAVELMAYNYATFALSPYGPFWRQMRKLTVIELLSNRRLQTLVNLQASEVKFSIKRMFEAWVKDKGGDQMVQMDMKEWLGSLTLNSIVTIVTGKRFLLDDESGMQFEHTQRKFMELMGTFMLADSIPSLRWLDLGGYEKKMKATFKEMDDTFQGWVDEHREKRKNNSSKQEDFIDVILSLFEGDSPKEPLPAGFDVDTIVKSLCHTVIAGASDTTHATLTWALTLLLNNPRVLKKAQEEIDEHVGRERQVEEFDTKNFTYLNAIIKETLRLYPAAPLLVPHESMEDCVVGGYNIPKGTTLLVNTYKIHRNQNVWPDPYAFLPERFLNGQKEIDVGAQSFEWMPFGGGRRMCPGINFGFQSMQLILASLIHGFEIKNPSSEPIDMEEGFGLTVLKATPVNVLLKPRLLPELYV